MKKKAILAIGIIALFVGMTIIPIGASVDTITKKVENAKTSVDDYREYNLLFAFIYGIVCDPTIKEYNTLIEHYKGPLGIIQISGRYSNIHLKGTAQSIWVGRPYITVLEDINGKTIEVECMFLMGDILSDDDVGFAGNACIVNIKVWD